MQPPRARGRHLTGVLKNPSRVTAGLGAVVDERFRARYIIGEQVKTGVYDTFVFHGTVDRSFVHRAFVTHFAPSARTLTPPPQRACPPKPPRSAPLRRLRAHAARDTRTRFRAEGSLIWRSRTVVVSVFPPGSCRCSDQARRGGTVYTYCIIVARHPLDREENTLVTEKGYFVKATKVAG